MSTFAIGDIHGCLTALETLYVSAGITNRDSVIFLGDYVDRGPNSAQVINWILEIEVDKLITLRGNHEIMMMEFRNLGPHSNPHSSSWLKYGGSETLSSYHIAHSDRWYEHVPQEHWRFLENTLPYYNLGDIIFVHAALRPTVPLHQQLPQALFWKKLENPKAYAPNKKVICGHTAQKDGNIANYGHTICIDTCAYGGQWLTCLDVDSGQYWQANQTGDVRMGRLD
ncbi:MAG: serine/threonine protein phosphatase [Saprospiraceae bacterium]|nr:serine/threonine protein phosphatase [Saprospiraceae bacterium]